MSLGEFVERVVPLQTCNSIIAYRETFVGIYITPSPLTCSSLFNPYHNDDDSRPDGVITITYS